MFTNKVIIFVVSRYFSYFIQFLNSLLIAYVLGPYFMGIWGFLALVLQYLNFGNLGIDLALNVKLSTGNLKDTQQQSHIASNALMATIFTSCLYLLSALVLYISGISLFEKYMFTDYMLLVIVISCLNYFNILFLNIFRTYSLFTPISIFQLFIQLFQLPVLFILKEETLILGLLFMLILAHAISLFVFMRKMPVRLQFRIDGPIIGDLYKRGLSLLSYALTFYILLLSTRSMVGYFYPVETMGLFTFTASIASALIVGLSSLEFVLFPKMLNRLSTDSIKEESLVAFKEVRFVYRSTAFLVVLIGLLGYPVLLFYFKDYQHTETIFAFLVLCQIIISSGFGYSTLIISKGREFFLVIHGLIALSINLILALVSVRVFKIDYSYLSLMLIFSFLYYDYQVVRKGRSLLKLGTSFFEVAEELIPRKTLPSVVLIVIAVATQHYALFYTLSLALFIVFNYKGYFLIKKYVSMLFNKPSVVNIKND